MAKIVFVQPLAYEYPGTEILSACLRFAGHTTDLVISGDPHPGDPALKGADLIAFSLMTGYADWALGVAQKLKTATGAKVILGGAHPTHCPEIIDEGPVDAICRGEGEEALTELANGLDLGRWDTTIRNLWIKEGGAIHRNPMRPPVANLDELPHPDREIYYRRYPFLAKAGLKPFQAGRGCPYNCVFCSNRALRELYPAPGLGVRMKSPGKLIEEIEAVRLNHGLQKLIFHDDTFTINRRWTEEFLDLYRTTLALPFHCQSRADTLTPSIAAKLKAAGCRTVFFAVETGVEKLRREVLKKNLGDSKIRDGAKMVKDAGIALSTYNLIGIPGETLEMAFETVRMNIEIGADYPRSAFPTPYPGTELLEIAKKSGIGEQTVGITPLSQQTEARFTATGKDAFQNLHSLFQLAVLIPPAFPLVRRLVHLPLGPLYRVVWATTYGWIFLRSEGRSPLDSLPLAWFLIKQKLRLKKS